MASDATQPTDHRERAAAVAIEITAARIASGLKGKSTSTGPALMRFQRMTDRERERWVEIAVICTAVISEQILDHQASVLADIWNYRSFGVEAGNKHLADIELWFDVTARACAVLEGVIREGVS